MSKRIDETLSQPGYDGLIVGNEQVADVFTVTIRKLSTAATLNRGTVLALSASGSAADGKMVVLGNDAKVSSQKFSGTGSATTFAVTAKPAVVSGVKVGTTAVTAFTYDASTGVVTCAAAPASGTDNVEVSYIAEKLSANCILCDDVAVGTVADVEALAYRAGKFNTTKLIVKTGYTMTAADKEALRNGGILLDTAINA